MKNAKTKVTVQQDENKNLILSKRTLIKTFDQTVDERILSFSLTKEQAMSLHKYLNQKYPKQDE